MKRLAIIIMILLVSVSVAGAQDVREAARKAAEERARQERLAREAEQEILQDRGKLTAEVTRLETRQARLEATLDSLQVHMESQEELRLKLADRWEQSELDFKEISGNVRLAAKNVETLLHQSPFTAEDPGRLGQVRPLLQPGYFPDIEDITGLTAVLLDEIQLSGQVRLHQGQFVGRDGQETQGTILNLGKFTAAYQTADETGFLNYSPEGRRLVALANLPKGGLAGDLEDYFAGEGARVPIDISAGGALRQVSHQTTLWEQIEAGGPLVWPILALATVALLIVIYKAIYLNTVAGNTSKLMGRMNELAEQGDWEGCEELVARKRTPVIHVLAAGLGVRRLDRETQESVLQEAILSQLPKVERGMAVLAVLGAVAPLLGLLGTVTGMIETFRVITLYGTGDPKLMSGGISEALVTTMLGLAVAIPIMLLHTFLNRRVHAIIGDMEERAVQLANIFQKQQVASQAQGEA
ncbi:biopolymer transporter ExbB [bacterium]|nr:biopolymer transporter ExbB [bacterium]